MFRNFFKTGVRNLWKNKTYSFLNIFGLAVGIACAGLIFLWIEDERQFDHSHIKRDQLYKILENQTYEGKTHTFSVTPGPLSEGIKKDIPGIVNSCRMSWQQYTLFSLNEKSIYERGFFADSSVFNMFTIDLVQGKTEHVFRHPKSIVISEKMAEKFFGNEPGITGRTLLMNNKEEYMVTGVMKDLPANSTIKFDWLSPFSGFLNENQWLNSWGNNSILTYVELEEKADPDLIQQNLYGYIQTIDTTAIAKLLLHPMKDWRLRSKFEEGKNVGGRIQYVKMFSVIAWIILLIACINFMNLATARSEKRAREVGVRKVLGAAKYSLVLQFIGEALLMSFISMIIAVGIITLVIPFFNRLVVKDLTIGFTDTTHLVAFVSVGMLCGLVAGSYPALYLSSFNPIGVFKGLRIRGATPAIIRKGLVILQFTISISLIIGTIVISRQIRHVKSRELGFNKNNLIQTGLRGSMKKNFPAIKQELMVSGHVDNAALASQNLLYSGSSTTGYRWQGKDPAKQVLITEMFVTPGYISTFGIRIQEGRDFHPASVPDSFNVIINRTLANMIGTDPIGKQIIMDTSQNSGISYTVVGITDDFVFGDMYAKSDPLIFRVQPDNFGYLYVRLKPETDKEEAISGITNIIKSHNPGFPFNYVFVDDEFELIFKSEDLIGNLSRVFALLAIIISCLGLFGLAAYTAERRTKEIGIRKVLGASVPSITGLLSKDFLRLVFFSALIAFPFSWWAMNKWLQNYEYRVRVDWWIFILAGLLALLIALFTISFQSVRAATGNPVKSLRTE